MKQLPQDLRTQTLNLVKQSAPAASDQGQVAPLISAWLTSLEEEDFAGITPECLASVLWDGFSQAAMRTNDGCQIASLRYADGRSGFATALLILNEDMPFLVDSIVMAMRKK